LVGLLDRPWLPGLFNELDIALAIKHIPPGPLVLTPEPHIDAGAPDGQSAKGDVGQPAGEIRIDVEMSMRSVGSETEKRLEQMKC
jgi:hypothetical protein